MMTVRARLPAAGNEPANPLPSMGPSRRLVRRESVWGLAAEKLAPTRGVAAHRLFFVDVISTGRSAGVYKSISTDDGLNFSQPVLISNFYWVGQSFPWGSKTCYYAGGNHPAASQGLQ